MFDGYFIEFINYYWCIMVISILLILLSQKKWRTNCFPVRLHIPHSLHSVAGIPVNSLEFAAKTLLWKYHIQESPNMGKLIQYTPGCFNTTD